MRKQNAGKATNGCLAMMNTYHFIPITRYTTTDELVQKAATGAVLCFDLEDTISKLHDEQETVILKAAQRAEIARLFTQLHQLNIYINACIRVNAFSSAAQLHDIDWLAKLPGSYGIIVPKIDTAAQLAGTIARLKACNVNYTEVIPLVESKTAISNLSKILAANNGIKRAGFGHCDYNMSIGMFPFFHQNSSEYWKWVRRIIEIIKPFNIQFINSFYPELGNDAFFTTMLSHVNLLAGGNCAQFVLTGRQALLCSLHNNIAAPAEAIKNRHNLQVTAAGITAFIKRFKHNNTGKPFTIVGPGRKFISPHEYYTAQQLLHNIGGPNVYVSFAGGCFPVQDDILFEDLFHQVLKRKMKQELQANLQLNITRYERFANCLEKIEAGVQPGVTTHLVFHIRMEPFLRLAKLYYRYLDDKKRLKHSLNLPLKKVLNPEKYDALLLSRRYNYDGPSGKNILYRGLIDCNYAAGWLMGNHHYALKKYAALVNQVVAYCATHNIQPIIIGPAIRSNTYLERFISKQLDAYIQKHVNIAPGHYINGMVPHNHNGIAYFNKNGIHATGQYHAYIAEKLFNKISKDIAAKPINVSTGKLVVA